MTRSTALNFFPEAEAGCEAVPISYAEISCPCVANVSGCTSPLAVNYNSNATVDDGTCIFPDGCTNSTALNYSPNATNDDGSCIPNIRGCTASSAANYNSQATVNDGSCEFPVFGCTNTSEI